MLNQQPILALFHRDPPLSCRMEEIRNQPEDRRYVLFAEYPQGRYVVKCAANGFTTPQRVVGWTELISVYKTMGCYSPAILPGRNGALVQRLRLKDTDFVVWEEEHAQGFFPSAKDYMPVNNQGTRLPWQRQLLDFWGRVGQAHLTCSWGNSGWNRLVPFSAEDTCDEVTECVEAFDGLVREKAPEMVPRWESLLARFQENQRQLERVYPQLPVSVFQADMGDDNLLIDENGDFLGLIDYNLAGQDAVLNQFLSQGLYGAHVFGFGSAGKGAGLPNLNREHMDGRVAILGKILAALGETYAFSEIEVQAAPLLYRYIVPVSYDAISLLEKHWQDPALVNQIFDGIQRELDREIPFGQMLLE